MSEESINPYTGYFELGLRFQIAAARGDIPSDAPEPHHEWAAWAEGLLTAAAERDAALARAEKESDRYAAEHRRLSEVLGILSDVLPPGADIREALLSLRERAERAEELVRYREEEINTVAANCAHVRNALHAVEAEAKTLRKALERIRNEWISGPDVPESDERLYCRWCGSFDDHRPGCPVVVAESAIAGGGEEVKL